MILSDVYFRFHIAAALLHWCTKMVPLRWKLNTGAAIGRHGSANEAVREAAGRSRNDGIPQVFLVSPSLIEIKRN
jgi:hypothetical protein